MMPHVHLTRPPTIVPTPSSSDRASVRAKAQPQGGTDGDDLPSFGSALADAGGGDTFQSSLDDPDTGHSTKKTAGPAADDPVLGTVPASPDGAPPVPVSLYQITLPPTPAETAKIKAAAELDAASSSPASAFAPEMPGVKPSPIRPHGSPLTDPVAPSNPPKAQLPAIDPHGPPEQPDLEPVAGTPGGNLPEVPTKLPPVVGNGAAEDKAPAVTATSGASVSASVQPTKLPPVTGPVIPTDPGTRTTAATVAVDDKTQVPPIEPHSPPVMPFDNTSQAPLIAPHDPPVLPADDAPKMPLIAPHNPPVQSADDAPKVPVPVIRPHGSPVLPTEVATEDGPLTGSTAGGEQARSTTTPPPGTASPSSTSVAQAAVAYARTAPVYLPTDPVTDQPPVAPGIGTTAPAVKPTTDHQLPDPNPPMGSFEEPLVAFSPSADPSTPPAPRLTGSVVTTTPPVNPATDRAFPATATPSNGGSPVTTTNPAADRAEPVTIPPMGGVIFPLTNPDTERPSPNPNPPGVRAGGSFQPSAAPLSPTSAPATQDTTATPAPAAPMQITTALQAQAASPALPPTATTTPTLASSAVTGEMMQAAVTANASSVASTDDSAPAADTSIPSASPANLAARRPTLASRTGLNASQQQSQVTDSEQLMNQLRTDGTSVANEQADMTAAFPEPTIDRSDLLRRGPGAPSGRAAGAAGAGGAVAGLPTFQVNAPTHSAQAAQDVPAATANAVPMADRVAHILQTVLDAGIKAGAQATGQMDLHVRLDGGANDVTVHIQMNENRMHVTFQTDSAGLRQALESGWSDFTTHASRSAAVTVDPPAFSGAPSGQSAGTGDFSQRQQNPARQDAGRDLDFGAPSLGSAPRPATTFTTTTPTTRPASTSIQGTGPRWTGWA